MKFTFGDIVIVEDDYIGVIVKSWLPVNKLQRENTHEVYVRSRNAIKTHPESELR